MARNLGSDFLHSFRFHVIEGAPDASNPARLNTAAGFSACTTPEASVEAVEYREGKSKYTRKQAGIPSMTDITLSRGVAKTDSDFWNWMKVCMEGPGGYRQDLTIYHYHRDEVLLGSAASAATTVAAARQYQVSEAFPMRCKVASDLDGTASEISIQEIDFSYEHFDIVVPGGG